jgi:hypothetical protein
MCSDEPKYTCTRRNLSTHVFSLTFLFTFAVITLQYIRSAAMGTSVTTHTPRFNTDRIGELTFRRMACLCFECGKGRIEEDDERSRCRSCIEKELRYALTLQAA